MFSSLFLLGLLMSVSLSYNSDSLRYRDVHILDALLIRLKIRISEIKNFRDRAYFLRMEISLHIALPFAYFPECARMRMLTHIHELRYS